MPRMAQPRKGVNSYELLPDEAIVQEPAAYWRIHLVDTQAAWSDLEHVVEQLREKIRSLDPDFDGEIWDGWPIPKPGLNRSGSVKTDEPAGIRPVLYLMALQKRTRALAPGVRVSLATEDGIEIGYDLRSETAVLTSFGTDLESVRPLAETLGLLQPKINLAVAIRTDHDSWF